jgi:hypothetical protein
LDLTRIIRVDANIAYGVAVLALARIAELNADAVVLRWVAITVRGTHDIGVFRLQAGGRPFRIFLVACKHD